MSKLKTYKAKKNRRFSLVVKFIAAVLSVVLLVGGYSLAKYIAIDAGDSSYEAESFYVSSNLLKPKSDNQFPSYALKNGVNSVEFDLRNYADDLRISEVDVSYSYTIDGRSLTPTAVSEPTVGADGKKTLNVLIDGLSKGEHTIVVTTSPYKTELGAKFIVSDQNATPQFKIVDQQTTLVLYVTTYDFAGDITVTWPEGVKPDNTESKFRTAIGQSHVISVDANSEYSFVFLKEKTATSSLDTEYKIEDFEFSCADSGSN